MSFDTLSCSSQKPFWPIGNSQLSQRTITQIEPLSTAKSIFRGSLKAISQVEFIAKQFEGLLLEKNAGFIMPWPHYAIAHNVNWGDNFKRIHCLLNLLGYGIQRHIFLYFPAGSFFWARVDSLFELLRLNLRTEDFCNEPTPGDGSMAHAIERCVGLIPMLQNRNCYAYWTGDFADGFLEAKAATIG